MKSNFIAAVVIAIVMVGCRTARIAEEVQANEVASGAIAIFADSYKKCLNKAGIDLTNKQEEVGFRFSGSVILNGNDSIVNEIIPIKAGLLPPKEQTAIAQCIRSASKTATDELRQVISTSMSAQKNISRHVFDGYTYTAEGTLSPKIQIVLRKGVLSWTIHVRENIPPSP